ncbi:hypothetical protein MMC10_008009 [Thelotrema lepadinum]|nr:hypothetical protein [Thelotrema lepadinum]
MAAPPPLPPALLSTDTQGPAIIAANLTVAILATIGVALRFIARYIHRAGFGADDWLILAALPFGWGMCIATIIAVNFGLGRHVGTVLPQDLLRFGQAYFSTELLWATSIPLIKISILLLYIRIFGRQRYFRLTAYSLSLLTICWSIMVILVCAFQCRPVSYIWDKSIAGGSCIDALQFFVVGSTIDVVTDFAILLLPLPSVVRLQLGVWQRVGLVAVFLLGSLTCVFSLVRLVVITQQLANFDLDVTWASTPIAIWSTAEPCLGILAACLPTLRPLFARFITKVSSTNRSRTTPSGTTPVGRAGDSYRLGKVSRGTGSGSGEGEFVMLRERDGEGKGEGDVEGGWEEGKFHGGKGGLGGRVRTECRALDGQRGGEIGEGIEVEVGWEREVDRR